MSSYSRQGQEELLKLIDLLPSRIGRIMSDIDYERIQEFVLDLGREVEIRYSNRYENIVGSTISQRDLEEVLVQVGEFGPDDRTGVDGTLHRISRINNRLGECVGLTFRVGRNHPSNIELITDLLQQEESILLLGAPASGKTTFLRSIAHFASTQLDKRVVVIDTSNEIGGEGDIPHPAIGRARRMQVPRGQAQAEIMIRAVENHNPNVLIIDEISAHEEVEAARTIAQRGIQLIATAHGKHLEDLILNPPLSFLVGGVDKVTVSDETMVKSGLKSKTKLEREMEPTFGVVVELVSFDTIAIHPCVKEAVDCLLSEGVSQPEERRILVNPQNRNEQRVHVVKDFKYTMGHVVTGSALTPRTTVPSQPRASARRETHQPEQQETKPPKIRRSSRRR